MGKVYTSLKEVQQDISENKVNRRYLYRSGTYSWYSGNFHTFGQHSNGMPFGIQGMGKNFGEQQLLTFSKYLMDNNKQESNV